LNYKIGFIGAGNIAGAIITGILENGDYSRNDIFIYDIDNVKREKYKKEGFNIVKSEAEAVKQVNVVFLTIKPSDLKTVLERISPVVTLDNVLVSVVAGISIDFIKKIIGKECKVVRAMPNTPLLIGNGATAIAYEMPITYSELSCVKNIFETAGVVEVIPENRMNEIISVNGSGPAYIYMLAKAMIDGAVSQGIESEVAKRLVVETIIGSARMISATGESIEELIKKVSSPNGTTVKAVEQLEKRGFEQAVSDAMLNCTKRAYQLEKELDI
jgi:pyrroline-5-carboxylate reductase